MNTNYFSKKFQLKQFLFAFMLIISSFELNAQANCVDSSLINPMAICPAIYAPVCGCNNVTYGNECEAINLGGVTSWTPGECSGGGSSCVDSSLINPNVACPLIYAPVCGCNGITYGNACEAENYGGVTSWTNGPCNGGNGCVDPSLINLNVACPAIYDPVCGCNGVTYENSCVALNHNGVSTWTPGPCNGGSGCIDTSMIDPSIMCPAVFDPVCGCDGNTYGNACEAENWYGITAWTPGPCNGGSGCIDTSMIDPSIMCPAVFDPVCGCDGNTYGNACEAENWYGITAWTPGPCNGGSGCIDSSLIDVTVLCNSLENPVCGCDGVTYFNFCVAQSYFGVTSWTPGPCGGVIFADPCTNLASVEFGECDMFLGFGQINGVCTAISGCGFIVNGIDYSTAIFATSELCDSACIGNIINSAPCLDLDSLDFGACALVLGVGVVNGQCTAISGCSTVIGNMDYAPSIYSSMDSCTACLSTNQIGDLTQLEINLYPNPTNGKLTVQLSSEIHGEINVIDLAGRILASKETKGISQELDLSHLSSGTYYVQVKDENATVVRKIVKY